MLTGIASTNHKQKAITELWAVKILQSGIEMLFKLVLVDRDVVVILCSVGHQWKKPRIYVSIVSGIDRVWGPRRLPGTLTRRNY